VPDDRSAQLAANLRAQRERIAAACVAAGRSPDSVTLVAVSKTYPASDVVALARLGVTEIGENRDQEAAGKAAEVAAAGVEVRWHFVGRLQRNKCRSVVRYASVVHSVDSVALAGALAKAAVSRTDPLDVLVQVSLDGDPDRGGAFGADVERVAAAVAGADRLALRGVMAVAPLSGSPDEAYERLATVAERLRVGFPTATVISAGMSGDLEPAIRNGATHVRIGSALLGKRPGAAVT